MLFQAFLKRLSIFATIFISILFVLPGCGSVSLESLTAPLIPLEQAIVFWNATRFKGDWTLEPQVEDVWFQSADGTRLNGWYAEAREPRAVVLFAHGNAGNITDLRSQLHVFRDQLHTSILIFDYRGYGKSSGKPTEAGVVEDARAARHWLATRAATAERDIVLGGHSLGGGVA